MDLLLQTIVNGLIQGSFFALSAIGLVLIFGVMRVVNFAHGEFLMIGAYCVWLIHDQWHYSFLTALLLAVTIVTILGVLMEVFLFRPKRDDQLGGLICSLGMLFILQVIAHLLGGTGPSKQVSAPFDGYFLLFDLINIPNQRLFSFLVVIASLLLLWLFLTRTKFGWSLRAVAIDTEAAALQGININRTCIIAMAISAGLSGLAGALLAPLTNINPYMGHNFIITAFIVTIVGGIGSLSGAVIAAFIYALLHAFITTYFDGTIATITGLTAMLLILIVRPGGIMASKT